MLMTIGNSSSAFLFGAVCVITLPTRIGFELGFFSAHSTLFSSFSLYSFATPLFPKLCTGKVAGCPWLGLTTLVSSFKTFPCSVAVIVFVSGSAGVNKSFFSS